MRKDEKLEMAHRLFLERRGKITPKEIAAQIGTTPEKVRKWKYRGKWEQELTRPHRGGQPGNQNARGKGERKRGNQNAVTHGAYASPRLDRLPPEERERIESIQAEFDGNAVTQLRRLETKRADLEQRIAALRDGPEDAADLIDRSMTIRFSDGKEARYEFQSSAFSRRMILEEQIDRVDRQIGRLLDSIRNQEAEQRRHELDRERLDLKRQQIEGIYETGPAADPEEIEIVKE